MSSDRIEVSSEMADAGAHALEEWGEIADQSSLAEKVYIAMETARRWATSRLTTAERIHIVHQAFEHARQTGTRAPTWAELDRLTGQGRASAVVQKSL